MKTQLDPKFNPRLRPDFKEEATHDDKQHRNVTRYTANGDEAADGDMVFFDDYSELASELAEANRRSEMRSNYVDELKNEIFDLKAQIIEERAGHEALRLLAQGWKEDADRAKSQLADMTAARDRTLGLLNEAIEENTALRSSTNTTVPLGTISECPSCEGEGWLHVDVGGSIDNKPTRGDCWRCAGSGRVMAYRELPEQFDARMRKLKTFVAEVNRTPPEGGDRWIACADRFPHNPGSTATRVLAWVVHDGMGWPAIRLYSNRKWWSNGDEIYGENITHWQDLPGGPSRSPKEK